jgi:hypothetical protein
LIFFPAAEIGVQWIWIVLRLGAVIAVADKPAMSATPLGPEHRGTPARRSRRAGARSPDPAGGGSEPGKMAAYAVRALALLGSDATLTTIVALAIRYLTENKNIGEAAVEASAEAAKRLGITPGSSGDGVVPLARVRAGHAPRHRR